MGISSTELISTGEHQAKRRSKQIAAYAPVERVQKWEAFCKQYEPILSRSKLLLAAAEDYMERAAKYGIDIKTLRPLAPRGGTDDPDGGDRRLATAQKDKIEAFIRQIYREHQNRALAKDQIICHAQQFGFAPDVRIFFEDLHHDTYTPDRLARELNDVIQRRGCREAIGGLLNIQQIQQDWQKKEPKRHPS